MNTDNIKNMAESLFSIYFDVPFGYDCFLEETYNYKIIQKELIPFEPKKKELFDYYAFVAASKIFAHSVIYNIEDLIPNKNYINELNSNISQLKNNELKDLADYLDIFRNLEWNEKKECYINDAYNFPDKINFYTVVHACCAVMNEIINGYLLQIKTILKLTKKQEFWIDYLQINLSNENKPNEDELTKLNLLLKEILD
jgi:hypothetical protein